MYFQQFYLGCLAQASYMIGSEGEAAVVDPQRDVDLYLEAAAEQGLKIRHVIETHFHADFVSGHLELAARTDAKVYLGSRGGAKYPHVPLHQGDQIRFGKAMLRILETPGHTPECICILVADLDQSPEPWAILTGDTLFIGDIGRPDLLGAKLPAAQLAAMAYDSLHDQILTLPDSIKVYPGHGAGSACGRNLSNERVSTIGDQRRHNYALQPMSKEQFIQLMTNDLPEAPQYFSLDATINKEGPRLLEDVLAKFTSLTAEEVEQKQSGGAVLLDVRSPDHFAAGHIPRSVNVGLGGTYASWTATLLPADERIVVIAKPGKENEAATRLARVGYENVVGYLKGGVDSWRASGRQLASHPRWSANQLAEELQRDPALAVLDVRTPREWQAGHLRGALHLPLNRMSQPGQIERVVPRGKKLAVHCAGGYRSSIAISLLRQQGFNDIVDLAPGYDGWVHNGLPVTTD
jgi:glyoxylase-like metal-dependent hydrolase (beta-lactamase superfamily II)/rhodanese-related sulfurtransferase